MLPSLSVCTHAGLYTCHLILLYVLVSSSEDEGKTCAQHSLNVAAVWRVVFWSNKAFIVKSQKAASDVFIPSMLPDHKINTNQVLYVNIMIIHHIFIDMYITEEIVRFLIWRLRSELKHCSGFSLFLLCASASVMTLFNLLWGIFSRSPHGGAQILNHSHRSDYLTIHDGSFLIVSFSGPRMATLHVLWPNPRYLQENNNQNT